MKIKTQDNETQDTRQKPQCVEPVLILDTCYLILNKK